MDLLYFSHFFFLFSRFCFFFVFFFFFFPLSYLGVVLSFVVTVTGIFEYLQERNANDLMASFKNMLPPDAMTNRDGKGYQPLPATCLCRGDIVQISAGQKIPADIRVIAASDDMKVEQSVRRGVVWLLAVMLVVMWKRSFLVLPRCYIYLSFVLTLFVSFFPFFFAHSIFPSLTNK